MLVCPLCRIALAPGDAHCPRDGQQGRDAELEAVPPDLSERFRVVEAFGKGDSGSLYLADEVQTGRRGLLKVLHGKASTSVAERQRLKRELVKQATLSNPHLALPLVTGETAGATWFFREWVEGVSLRVRLARDGKLPVDEALAVASQLASALDELHRSGLLHRDLKPGHILLDPQPKGPPRVVVIDAGVSAPIESQSSFDVVGTPAYVSPEQASGKLVSFRSDLYALGCVLHEMITGEPPYTGSVDDVLRAHAEAEVPAAPSELPQGVQVLLGQLLAKEPRERPFSAQQARRTMEPFLEGGSHRDPTLPYEPEQHPVPAGEPKKPERKATLLGIPMQPLASKPPAPPQEHGGPARLSAPSKPPAPPGQKTMRNAPPVKPSVDPTQELDALDIEVVGAPAIPHALGAPPPAPAAPAALDYDELAETTLHVSKDMEIEQAMPQPMDGDRAIPPTQGMPAVDVDQSMLEQAAHSFMKQQPSPEQSGGFPQTQAQPQAHAQAQGQGVWDQHAQPQAQGVWDQQAQPQGGFGQPQPVQAYAGDTGDVPALPKKKSRAGVYVLVGVLLFCLGSAGAAAGGWWWLEGQAEQELAQLDRELTRQLETGAAPLPSEPGAFGQAEPGEPGGLVDEQVEPGAEPSEPAAEPVAEPAELTPAERRAAARAEREERAAAARAEREERAAAARSAREQRDAERRAEREARAAAARSEREERGSAGGGAAAAGGGGGASQFDQLREEARTHFQARRFAQAAQAYERAAAINPNHAATFAGMGAARGAAGDARGAVQAYQRAVELQPNHAGFNAALGRAYQMSGDRARAAQAYQRALALDPNNRGARQGLESL